MTKRKQNCLTMLMIEGKIKAFLKDRQLTAVEHQALAGDSQKAAKIRYTVTEKLTKCDGIRASTSINSFIPS